MPCADEKTAIQALDRLDPVLPLSPGRAECHGLEYYRHGAVFLYSALEVATGRVAGMPAPGTSADFLGFMDQLVSEYGRRRETHMILDISRPAGRRTLGRGSLPLVWDQPHRTKLRTGVIFLVGGSLDQGPISER